MSVEYGTLAVFNFNGYITNFQVVNSRGFSDLDAWLVVTNAHTAASLLCMTYAAIVKRRRQSTYAANE